MSIFKEAVKVLETCSETTPSIRLLARALKKELKKYSRHYIIHVAGGIEPSIVGPIKGDRARDLRARQLRRNNHEDDTFFWLDLDEYGEPIIGTYSNGFMEGLKGFTR